MHVLGMCRLGRQVEKVAIILLAKHFGAHNVEECQNDQEVSGELSMSRAVSRTQLHELL